MVAFSKEQLAEMLVMMDQDGDGIVTEDEFKVAVCLLHPKTTDAEFQELWKKIDSDESGHLDQEELATYFGFNLHEMEDDLQENRKRASMTDEQVLEALQMHTALLELEEKSRKKPEGERKKRGGRNNSRDLEGIEAMKLPSKIGHDDLPPKIEFMLACNSGDESDIKQAIADGIGVRLVDENGEMPLHKICRWGLKDCAKLVLDASKKIGPAARMTDINMPEKKKGWPPIFFAASFGHKELLIKMVEWGADLQQEDDQGCNILHILAQAGDEKKKEATKEFLSHEKVMPIKSKLMAHMDKLDQTPLHKAAWLADENVVSLMLNHGAKRETEDKSGNTPAQLAQRAGRKKSRELLEIPGLEKP